MAERMRSELGVVISWRAIYTLIDYACLFGTLGTTIALYWGAGMWCALVPLAYLLGGFSFWAFENARGE